MPDSAEAPHTRQVCSDVRALYGDNRARLCLRFLGREEHLFRAVRSSDLRLAIWEPDDASPGNVYIRLMDTEQWDSLQAVDRLEWCSA